MPENQTNFSQNGTNPAEPSQAESVSPEGTSSPKWEVLNATQRRVVGVLIEKAKTTPDAYPLTLNSLCNGCNQKSNRYPLTQLEPEQVEEALDQLRQKNAVFVVQSGGRVEKFRHNMYEWLGVSKQEIAVMAELLLRGAQTQGELRARAARMEPIASLTELKPIVQDLKQRGLIVSLTPEGRGHILTHNLYKPKELEKLREKYSQGAPIPAAPTPAPTMPTTVSTPSLTTDHSSVATSTPAPAVADDKVDSLQRENENLRTQIKDLDSQVVELTDRVEQTERALRELRDALGG